MHLHPTCAFSWRFMDGAYTQTAKHRFFVRVWFKVVCISMKVWFSNFTLFDTLILKCLSNPKLVATKNRKYCEISQMCPN